MRKSLLFVPLALVCANVNAQLLVQSGNVAVGMEYDLDEEPISKFSINSFGEEGTLSYIDATDAETGLFIDRVGWGTSDGLYNVGLKIKANTVNYKRNIGLDISSLKRYNDINTGCSMGIRTRAGGATNSFNFGVCAALAQGYHGAGIFASGGGSANGIATDFSWAGLFYGDVKVTDYVYTTGIFNSSDYRLKKDIAPIKEGTLASIMHMNAVQYNLRQMEIETFDDDSVSHYMFDEDSPALTKQHYGLIAQELQELYPDLVTEGDNGYLAVNYIEIIPLLIKSVQELNQKLCAITESQPQTRGDMSMYDPQASTPFQTVLYQNSPNPFTEKTVISCLVPEEVGEAVLYIYDANGLQIDKHAVDGRGETSVTIEGRSLEAGIYLYSLIADGSVVDTKRMILTK